MKAVAIFRNLPTSHPQSLVDIDWPQPVPSGRDLLVQVEAVSVNPVDTKVRARRKEDETEPRILGWDAAGIVKAVGPEAVKFRVGDEVYYAGDITRPGSNAEFQLVDERIVGRKPATLSFAEAASLPLTTLTVWEALFERMGIDPGGAGRGSRILIIGGAGGTGSIGIQLAKMAGLTVITTASRPETREWVLALGADVVLDHREPLAPQLEAQGILEVDYIANFSNTGAYWDIMAELICPRGHIVCIVETDAPLDLNALKSKSASFAWEFMFTASMYQTPDMNRQGTILDETAALIDAGKLRSTVTRILSPINAASLRMAHELIESGRSIGKITLAGWA